MKPFVFTSDLFREELCAEGERCPPIDALEHQSVCSQAACRLSLEVMQQRISLIREMHKEKLEQWEKDECL
jgi:hypothetical protein